MVRYDHRVYSMQSQTVEYSFLIYYSVNLRSDVYFSVLQHSCFLHSQPSVCSVWVGFGLSFAWRSFGGSCSFAFGVWAVTPACCRAALKCGIRNRKETENQNPLIKENKFFKYVKIYCAELLPLKTKNKRTSKFKKYSNKNSLCVEIFATVISSQGYDYENRNKVRCK